MRRYLIKALALIACLHGLAWTNAGSQGPTAMDLLAAFSLEHAQGLPQVISSASIENIAVSEDYLQFRARGITFNVKWIGESSRMIMLNGRMFSGTELSSFYKFQRAFRAKFGIRKKARSNAGIFSLIIPQALADDSTQADMNSFFENFQSSGEDQASKSQNPYVFEGMKKSDFTSYILGPGLYRPDASLGNTQAGKRLEAVFEMMTGSNQMAMIKFIYLFLGGISFAMNPADGFKPGMDLVNVLGGSPSSIPFPF